MLTPGRTQELYEEYMEALSGAPRALRLKVFVDQAMQFEQFAEEAEEPGSEHSSSLMTEEELEDEGDCDHFDEEASSMYAGFCAGLVVEEAEPSVEARCAAVPHARVAFVRGHPPLESQMSCCVLGRLAGRPRSSHVCLQLELCLTYVCRFPLVCAAASRSTAEAHGATARWRRAAACRCSLRRTRSTTSEWHSSGLGAAAPVPRTFACSFLRRPAEGGRALVADLTAACPCCCR